MSEAVLSPAASRTIQLHRRVLWFSPGDYVLPTGVFVVSRCILALLAWRAPHILSGPHIAANNSVLPHSAVPSWLWGWMSPWFRFDAAWYVGIAQHGYHWGSTAEANTNFLPLYSALIKAMSAITPFNVWMSSLIVSNLAFLAALLVLWRWASTVLGQNIAPRALLLVVAFPFSFFFAAPYTESLFLALTVGAFLAAERDRWLLATALAGACTITRPVGVAAVLGLAVMALSRSRKQEALLALLGVLPLAVFALFLELRFGHPLTFTVYHTYGWVPPRGGPWNSIAIQFHTKLSPFDKIYAFLAFLFLISAIPVWRRFGPGYATFVIVSVLMPLTKGLAGMERYVIVLFPVMAAWATWKSRWGQTLLFSISAFTLVIATVMFGSGYSLF